MQMHRVTVTKHGYTVHEPFPVRLVQTSADRWEGVACFVYDNQATPDWFTIASADNPVVALVTHGQLDGGIKIGGVGGSARTYRVPYASTALIPAQFSGEFHWHTSYQCLHAQLKADFLARLLAEVVDADPARTALALRPLLSDPLMTDMLLAIKNEMTNDGLLGRIYVESLASLWPCMCCITIRGCAKR
jgi:hypothetical protein